MFPFLPFRLLAAARQGDRRHRPQGPKPFDRHLKDALRGRCERVLSDRGSIVSLDHDAQRIGIEAPHHGVDALVDEHLEVELDALFVYVVDQLINARLIAYHLAEPYTCSQCQCVPYLIEHTLATECAAITGAVPVERHLVDQCRRQARPGRKLCVVAGNLGEVVGFAALVAGTQLIDAGVCLLWSRAIVGVWNHGGAVEPGQVRNNPGGRRGQASADGAACCRVRVRG